MRIVVYEHPYRECPELTAFGAGLSSHDQPWMAGASSASTSSSVLECDLAIFWGHRRNDVISRQRAAGAHYLVLERGYVGDRFLWTSARFDGQSSARSR